MEGRTPDDETSEAHRVLKRLRYRQAFGVTDLGMDDEPAEAVAYFFAVSELDSVRQKLDNESAKADAELEARLDDKT